MPRIEKEEDLLDEEIRKRIIADIASPENQGRKDEAYKRHQCLNERTKSFVVKELLKQFDGATVEEMSYCLSNIPITKKIVGKLARVYSNGVKRTVHKESDDEANNVSEEMTDQLEDLCDVLDLDANMKKTNRYLKLHHNTAVFIKPVPDAAEEMDADYDGDTDKWRLKVVVMPPYLYDVIEQYHDREKALCYIFSHYSPMGGGANSLLATNIARAGRAFLTPTIKPEGDNRDEIIANAPSDKDKDQKEYIFWSKKYHFTCNEKGEIIKSNIGENDQPTPDNPIQMLPIKEFVIEQDGTFWSQGGGAIVDGDILVNSMITNILHIGVTQGYGQFWMMGKNLPKQIKTGPTKAITFEVVSKDDPTPSLGFAHANPPLSDLMKLVEMYTALLLTTNNLTSTGISSKLDTMKNEASGIALIIDKAESMEDVKDQEQIFVDGEPDIFEIVSAWLNYFGSRDLLCEELVPFKDFPRDLELGLKFGDYQPIMSEGEKLSNIQMRAKLGLNTIIELLMKDDPNLNEDQAEERLIALLEDKIKNALLWQTITSPMAQQPDPNASKANPMDGGGKVDNVTGETNNTDPGQASQGDQSIEATAGGQGAKGNKSKQTKTNQTPDGSNAGGARGGPGPG